ncbi:hypothetical protein [Chitinophaga sp. sic0106]|uniref:hypothetical protein n=1 Tax=Chitinophaga sp. sic0106 TaxID=2854785 RepID=UPI001C493190|nr:hypothetical protein [Chitinophaga sp. sic0106]MBV7529779.1 hypothetical protein [Chitinophaga sp. sic0106]
MPLTKVMITVKSYPTLSSHYDEQLSIAGFRDDGTFIRIYPISFSQKIYEEQYQLYDWIEINLERNPRDFRLESFRPVDPEQPVKKLGHVGAGNYWQERKALVQKHVYRNLENLLMEAKHEAFYTSLAVFKPQRILSLDITPAEKEWDSERLAKMQQEKYYPHVFMQEEEPMDAFKKLPFRFSFRFLDDSNKEISLPVEDFQLASHYWKLLKKQQGPDKEAKAASELRKKYLQEYVRNTDLHFFLGTTQNVHASAKQPFTIIGLFHPVVLPAVVQGSLF